MDQKERINLATDIDVMSGMINVFLGRKIGEGCTRTVYEHAFDSTLVVKIDRDEDSLDNIKEFLFWQSVGEDEEKSKWLCPIICMSTNGRILIQKKMKPITEKNKKNIPVHIPEWLTDMKFSNYGFIGNQFVCCDYAMCSGKVRNAVQRWKSHLGED